MSDSAGPLFMPIQADQELETILDAWQTATDRLQSTHQTLSLIHI